MKTVSATQREILARSFVSKAVFTVESRKRIEAELLKIWTRQAQSAIAQGQTLNDFILHCTTSDRAIARKAYRIASKQQISIDGLIREGKLIETFSKQNP